MPESSGLQAITAIVPVREMRRSIDFYEALGFLAQLYEDGAHYAFMRMDGSSLHLRKAVDGEFSYNPGGVYLYVTDVDSFYAHAIANGIRPIDQPHARPWGMREFAISDPDELLVRIGTPLK